MGEPGDTPKVTEEGAPPVLAPTLRVINQLVDEGLIDSYVIGGSIAILYYSEPFSTEDLDVFCYLPGRPEFFHLGPVWQRLEALGYSSHGLYITINGVDVQFLSPGPQNDLEAEAMESSVPILVEGVSARVFQLEYAMAIKVKAGRWKDWNHIEVAMSSAEPDIAKLQSLLEKFKDDHGVKLSDKWEEHYRGLR